MNEQVVVTTLMEMISSIPTDDELLIEHNKPISAAAMGIINAHVSGNADVTDALCQSLFMYGVIVGQEKCKEEWANELDIGETLMEMFSSVPRDEELLTEHRRQITATSLGVINAYLGNNADVILGFCQGLFMYGVTVGQGIGRENLGKAWETAVDDEE